MGLDFVIVEKGQQVGGTWLWNKYPGVEDSRGFYSLFLTLWEFLNLK